MLEYFYNEKAQVYDDTYDAAYYKAEDEDLFRRIQAMRIGSTVLDIGCGTGILLDYISVDPKDYVGIDPTHNMLTQFADKHPGYTTVETPLEHFETAEVFDTVVALYGSPSYIDPAQYEKISDRVRSGGALCLLFYKPGYFPRNYTEAELATMEGRIDYNKIVALGSHAYIFNNYVMITNAEQPDLEPYENI